MNLVDLNARVAIAFSLALIAALLVYVAFFKDAPVSRSSPSRKK